MNNGILTGKIYTFCNWAAKLVYANILWFVFTLLGFIVFGVFPATTGLYTIIRKWLQGFQDVPIFGTFWNAYKEDFLKANVFGYIFLIIGMMLYIDLIFFQYWEGLFNEWLFYVVITLFLIYLLTFMYLFPIFVYYDVKVIQYIKLSFIIMILNPFTTFLMMMSGIAINLLMYFIPGLIPFYGISLFVFIQMWLAFIAFKKLDKKKYQNNLKEAIDDENGNVLSNN